MTQPSDINDVHLFVAAQIQQARNFPPGPQYADDPERLLHVMQATIQRFQNVDLPPAHVERLYETFQTEAQHYRQQYHKYIAHDAYKDVMENIKSMLDRMKSKT